MLGLAFAAVAARADAPPPTLSDYRAVAGWPTVPADVTFGPVSAVATDAADRVYVAHRGPRPVLVFDRGGTFLRSWGQDPARAADRPGRVRLADRHRQPHGDEVRHRLQAAALARHEGRGGADAAHFDRPTDVAQAPTGEFYVSDGYGNARVLRFARDGKLLAQWGKKGTGPGEFHLPHAVCLDPKGRVYVGDRENNRVQVFDRDGKFLHQWKESGAPYGLFLAGDRLFVADGRADWVEVLNLDGKALGRFGETGAGPGQFRLPHMLCVDTKGSVYVAEVNGKRVQKFAPAGK
jgi:DNA-binding beta-propeller fold protein YncE